MYDPISKKHFSLSNDTDPMWWNGAEPLWITALDSGYSTAAMMWPGSDVTIRNRTPTHFFPYNPSVTFQERLGNVTNWLLGNEKVEISCLYVPICGALWRWSNLEKLEDLTLFMIFIIPPGTTSEVCSSLLGGARQIRSHVRPWQHHRHGQSAEGGTVIWLYSNAQTSLLGCHTATANLHVQWRK